MNTFSWKDRAKNLCNAQEKSEFDLIIIGGGITGAGVAREAALRGMRVVLLEAADFASGTSSRSSKLIHGGIRYLENLEFKLVFEALQERANLFEMAPHLVHPLRFMLPLYKESRVGMFKMGLGMWLYDLLAMYDAPETHERLDAQETFNRNPHLNKKNLLGSFVYSDGYMDDDLLTIETLRSAHWHGAACLNYVKAISWERVFQKDFEMAAKGSWVHRVGCKDTLSGENFFISGKHVVSCVGAWTDELGHLLNPQWKKVLRPTKGVHITFEKEAFSLTSAVVMAAEKSDRIVFGIPRSDMVIVGTTDTDFQGDPACVKVEKEDVDYLLGVANQYFPGASLNKESILSSYAGVRPLVRDEAGSEGKTSREHCIWSWEQGITFVAGGKYTTYRLMAEQILEECLSFFSIEKKVKWHQSYSLAPLNPLVSRESYKEALKESIPHLNNQDSQKLLASHGYEALKMVSEFGALSLWELEAHHGIQGTMCLNLVDFYCRRTHLFLGFKDHGISFLKKISNIFAKEFLWSKEEQEVQENKLMEYIQKELLWRNLPD